MDSGLGEGDGVGLSSGEALGLSSGVGVGVSVGEGLGKDVGEDFFFFFFGLGVSSSSGVGVGEDFFLAFFLGVSSSSGVGEGEDFFFRGLVLGEGVGLLFLLLEWRRLLREGVGVGLAKKFLIFSPNDASSSAFSSGSEAGTTKRKTSTPTPAARSIRANRRFALRGMFEA
ncbi:MAG: hypothetical protein ACR2G0_13655 [Chthoniobacterales bacterium]